MKIDIFSLFEIAYYSISFILNNFFNEITLYFENSFIIKYIRVKRKINENLNIINF